MTETGNRELIVRPFGSQELPVQVLLIWRDRGYSNRRGRIFEPLLTRRCWKVGQVLYRVNGGPVIEHAGPWTMGRLTWSVSPDPNHYDNKVNLDQWWDRVIDVGGGGSWEAEGFEAAQVGDIRNVVARRTAGQLYGSTPPAAGQRREERA